MRSEEKQMTKEENKLSSDITKRKALKPYRTVQQSMPIPCLTKKNTSKKPMETSTEGMSKE